MSMLAPTLQAFFTDRLTRQRNASPHTVAAYRDTLRLLLAFAHQQTGKQPCQLDLDDLDAPLIGAFLDHLEHERYTTASAPATPASRRSAHCFTTQHSRIPSTRRRSAACSQSLPSASSEL
jgi:site-specific recombinase XerD